ncbi:MAG TPA: cyclic pyranopterin monophosphate synthase MoaC [Candidatus Acidoferrum sp.]|nr:cyclic pyranopterin monophosphate synthase MoaC [Candidatus Acidoferrum sp.]
MSSTSKPSHIRDDGSVTMVDVGGKTPTAREARAQARVRLSEAAADALRTATLPKGDAFVTAQIAGIMAAKKTGELIPLCHPLALSAVDVTFAWDDATTVRIDARAATVGPTGVEMEAMVAASVAALTLYDMCKAIDKGIVIETVRLLAKSGGKSGTWKA